LIQSEPDPGFCARPEFVAGVRRLGPLGLSFDICVYHFQLPAVIALARAVPEVPMVLDHLGKPAIRDGTLDPWRQHLRELAQLPHVMAKVSGLATEADWRHWSGADLRPYFEAAVEAFGFDRLMFGSDWPVSTLAVGYQQWVDTIGEMLAGTASADRERLFAGTARHFYRLTT
jgi:L-fuconolactonase